MGRDKCDMGKIWRVRRMREFKTSLLRNSGTNFDLLAWVLSCKNNTPFIQGSGNLLLCLCKILHFYIFPVTLFWNIGNCNRTPSLFRKMAKKKVFSCALTPFDNNWTLSIYILSSILHYQTIFAAVNNAPTFHLLLLCLK